MPDVTFSFPTVALLNRGIAARAAKYGYQEQIWQNGSLVQNPESKGAFVKRREIELWIADTRAYETPPPTPPADIVIT